MRTTIGFLVIACCLGSACAGDGAAGTGQTLDPADAGPRLTEELRIDGVRRDLVPIGWIGGVTVRGDDVIALRQRQDNRIVFFDGSGEPAGSFGGPGEGPGEFRSIGRLGWLGDTLWVFDLTLGRMTLIAPELTLARTMIVPGEARPAATDSGRIPPFPFAMPLSPNPDGTFTALLSSLIGQDVPEAFREAAIYGIITSEGIIRSIHVISRVPEDGSVRSAAGVATVPLVNRPQYALAPDGSRSVFAEGLTDGEKAGSIRLTTFDAAGDTLFSRTYPFDPVPIPDAVADSVMAAREKQLRATSPALADAFRDQAHLPDHYPPVVYLIVGRDGSIWIERPGPDEERVYFAIAPDGEPIGSLALPPNSRIAAAERDRIWVLESDADDVESVVRQRVVW